MDERERETQKESTEAEMRLSTTTTRMEDKSRREERQEIDGISRVQSGLW